MTVQEALKDKDFQGLPVEEKRKALSGIDKDFAGLPKGEQDKVFTAIGAPAPEAKSKTFGQKVKDDLSTIASNVIPSGKKFIENSVHGLTHPIESLQGITDIAAGATEKIAGPPGVPAWDRKGKKGPNEASTEAAGQYFGNRFGHPYETLKQDPVGMLADVSSVLSLAGMGERLPGVAGTISKLAKTGAELTNPITPVSKTVSALRQGIGATQIPEWMMGHTMKMPPGSVRDEIRGSILDTLVRKEGLPLTGKTLPQMNKTIGELDNGITSTLENLSSAGSEFDIDVVTKALDDLKGTYKNRPRPDHYNKVIDQVKDDYINHAFVNQGKINLSDATELKKGTYAEIENYYKKQQKPETGRAGIRNDVEATAKAKAAAALREAVLSHPDVPPEIRSTMAKEAGLLNARKWVERALNRGGNLDPINLSGMLFGALVDGGLPGAIAYKIATSQTVMSRMAVTLARGSQKAAAVGRVAKPASLVEYQMNQINRAAE
jgi:hypothetical protein